MRTLHFGLRVADPGRSLAFYTAVGCQVVGSVPQTPLGHLTMLKLAARGIGAEAPVSPDGSHDFRTTSVIDPDGNRIELVQWPAGHPDGITAADWAE